MRTHRPVLLDEAIRALQIRPEGLYLDCTFGRGGHTEAILQELGTTGKLLAIDKDPQAVEAASSLFGKDGRFTIQRGSFSMVEKWVESRGWMGQVQGMLLDLGISSPQIDDPQRGFSFSQQGPLDMRMDPTVGISAAEWIATTTQRDIATVLKTYGDERNAKRIAKAIVDTRTQSPITLTSQLVAIITKINTVPGRDQHKHPATRCFQAIRIHINNELAELKSCLEQSLDILAIGGRIVVLSFHSLEDRIVKQFFRYQAKGDIYPTSVPITADQCKPKLAIIGKQLKPSPQEILNNPRARSAVLRVGEKIA